MRRNIILFLIWILVLLLFCRAKRVLFAPVLLEYEIIYPDDARQMGLEGKVFLGILINEEGRVEQVRILKSSASSILDSAALKTAHTFIFSPAMMGSKPIRIWVNLPVEFKFDEIKPDQWLLEVKSLQSVIEKEYREEKVMELYKLYKKLIFSPRKTIDNTINEYIRNAVLKKTAKLWDGYWQLYPAIPILFIDVVYRYPDSYASFEAGEEFKEYFEKEVITIRATLSQVSAETLIMRLNRLVVR